MVDPRRWIRIRRGGGSGSTLTDKHGEAGCNVAAGGQLDIERSRQLWNGEESRDSAILVGYTVFFECSIRACREKCQQAIRCRLVLSLAAAHLTT
jgi:hypothetical protein